MDETRVTIEFVTGDQSEPGTPERPVQPGRVNPENPAEPVGSGGGARKMAGLAVGGMLAKKSVGYMTSNVGKWTGSSQAQQGVNSAMTMIGYGAAIAANPALGLATIAFDLATKALDYAWERKWEERKTDELRRRSGNYLTGESR